MKISKKTSVVITLTEQEAVDLKKVLELKKSIGFVREVVISDRQKTLINSLLKKL